MTSAKSTERTIRRNPAKQFRRTLAVLGIAFACMAGGEGGGGCNPTFESQPWPPHLAVTAECPLGETTINLSGTWTACPPNGVSAAVDGNRITITLVRDYPDPLECLDTYDSFPWEFDVVLPPLPQMQYEIWVTLLYPNGQPLGVFLAEDMHIGSLNLADCNTNAAYDCCDLSSHQSNDLDENATPDECQPDCNSNQLPDSAESYGPIPGRALTFAAYGNRVDVPDFGSIAPTSEITVEFWQRADVVQYQSSFTVGDYAARNVIGAHVPFEDGAVYWDFGDPDNGGRLTYTPPQPIVGSWQHFAFVASQTGNYMRIYRNGILEAQKTGVEPFDRAGFPLVIGNQQYIVSHFQGRMDEFRIWSVARSAEEIVAHFAGAVDPASPGLLGYWRFDEPGPIAYDLTGHGHDGALGGVTRYLSNPLHTDCNVNLIPDECEPQTDCNTDGTIDICQLATDTDCNTNAILDRCDIVSGAALDVLPAAGDGIPDECQRDCNTNVQPDNVDLAAGASDDCNGNATPDECDIARGTSTDCDADGALDECQAGNAFSGSGSSLVLDGQNDFVMISTAIDLTANYTISAWVNLQAGGIYQGNRPAVVSSACGGSVELMIRAATNNPNDPQYLELGRCNYFNGTLSTTPVPLRAWTHVGVTVNANGIVTYYVNGQPAGSWDASAWPLSLRPSAIGATSDGGRYFTGGIDEVQIWNVARTAQEMAADYARVLPTPRSDLLNYWRFSEGTGTSTVDSAVGNLGQLRNGAQWNVPHGLCAAGDMNCDGANDVQDVPLFVTAMIDAATFTGCDARIGDMNSDGQVDGDDVQLFVSALDE